MINEINVDYAKHIDNGGVYINFHAKDNAVEIEFVTQYFGYPAVSASLMSCGFLGGADHRNIGLKFIEFANDLERQG